MWTEPVGPSAHGAEAPVAIGPALYRLEDDGWAASAMSDYVNYMAHTGGQLVPSAID